MGGFKEWVGHGDVLKNVIGMTGLGIVEPPLLKVAGKTTKSKKPRKGKGIGALAKLAAKALAPIVVLPRRQYWSPCAQVRCHPTGRCAYRPSVTL
jgi:hypothetical protein